MKMSLGAASIYGLVGTRFVGNTWQFAGVLVAAGMLLTVANTSANTFLQSQATDRNRGETASLFMLAMRGGLSLSNLAAGTLITVSSLPFTLVVNGILAVGFQALIFRKVLKR